MANRTFLCFKIIIFNYKFLVWAYMLQLLTKIIEYENNGRGDLYQISHLEKMQRKYFWINLTQCLVSVQIISRLCHFLVANQNLQLRQLRESASGKKIVLNNFHLILFRGLIQFTGLIISWDSNDLVSVLQVFDAQKSKSWGKCSN